MKNAQTENNLSAGNADYIPEQAEQLEMFDNPEPDVILPKPHSHEWIALNLMASGTLNQGDWLNDGYGWRLSATIKNLNYLGWQFDKGWMPFGKTRIRLYRLTSQCQGMARRLLFGGA